MHAILGLFVMFFSYVLLPGLQYLCVVKGSTYYTEIEVETESIFNERVAIMTIEIAIYSPTPPPSSHP